MLSAERRVGSEEALGKVDQELHNEQLHLASRTIFDQAFAPSLITQVRIRISRNRDAAEHSPMCEEISSCMPSATFFQLEEIALRPTVRHHAKAVPVHCKA